MKLLIASGVALALLAGVALAQSAPPAPAGVPTQTGPLAAPPPPPPGAPGIADDAGDPPAPPPPRGPHGRHPPPPPRAAHFRIERGDTAIDVKCAEDEPMRTCADFTLQLLDKLQSAPKP